MTVFKETVMVTFHVQATCLQVKQEKQRRCALFWDSTLHGIIVSYRRFGTTSRSHLQE